MNLRSAVFSLLAMSSCAPHPADGPSAKAPVAAPAAAESGPTVVYDSAHPTGVVRHALSAAEEAKVLNRLFPSFHTNASQCKGSGTSLAASRAAGDIVPSVESGTDGAFTAKGTGQVLYNVLVGECGASHAENWGSHELAVFEGDTLVMRANVEGGLTVFDRLDLEGDGLHELVLERGFSNMGETIVTGQIARLANGKLQVLKELGTLYEENCATMISAKREQTTSVTVLRAGDGTISYKSAVRTVDCRLFTTSSAPCGTASARSRDHWDRRSPPR